jgi:hypothetical protein
MHQMTTEPLLKQLLRYVMSDEARHVAFGVLSLQEYYKELSDAEMKDRQEFTFEAAVRMRDRFLQQEVWERMGVPVKDALELVMADEGRKLFQNILFSKIVPNCKKLGLLDRNKPEPQRSRSGEEREPDVDAGVVEEIGGEGARDHDVAVGEVDQVGDAELHREPDRAYGDHRQADKAETKGCRV